MDRPQKKQKTSTQDEEKAVGPEITSDQLVSFAAASNPETFGNELIWDWILHPQQTLNSFCLFHNGPFLDTEGFQQASPCVDDFRETYVWNGIQKDIWLLICSYINTCNWCVRCELHYDHTICLQEKLLWQCNSNLENADDEFLETTESAYDGGNFDEYDSAFDGGNFDYDGVEYFEGDDEGDYFEGDEDDGEYYLEY
jgi:hypothetical protein